VFAGELPSPGELRRHYAEYPASGELPALTARRYAELLNQLEPFRQTNNLLDVGCGDGHFLAVARERGWNTHGSEYGDAPRRRAAALGLDVRPAPFTASGEEIGSFDVVTAIEVLEHVPSPRDEVLSIASLLRPGGCLYLTTPNFNAVTRVLIGPRWRVIEYPEHLNFFTAATLDELLATAGLRRVGLRTTGIGLSDIWSAVEARRSDNACNRLDERLRAGVEGSPALDRALSAANAGLSWLRVGDTIKALYLRP
jgi:SAM-dependent methyltransferase